MTNEYTLETIHLIMPHLRLDELRELVKDGYLEAEPRRTSVVKAEDVDELKSRVVGAMARKTSPCDRWEL